MDSMADGASFEPVRAIQNALIQVDNTTELGAAYMSIVSHGDSIVLLDFGGCYWKNPIKY